MYLPLKIILCSGFTAYTKISKSVTINGIMLVVFQKRHSRSKPAALSWGLSIGSLQERQLGFMLIAIVALQ